jgi:hypothetical protein
VVELALKNIWKKANMSPEVLEFSLVELKVADKVKVIKQIHGQSTQRASACITSKNDNYEFPSHQIESF